MKIKLEEPITRKEYDRLIHLKNRYPYIDKKDILKIEHISVKRQIDQEKKKEELIKKQLKKKEELIKKEELKKKEETSYSKKKDKPFAINF